MESWWVFIKYRIGCIISLNLHSDPVCNPIFADAKTKIQMVLELPSDRARKQG